MQQESLDLAPLYGVIEAHKAQPGALIPVLQEAQEIYGWLPQEVLGAISREMRVPLSQVYGVVTFYSQFYLTRRGKHICRQCDGTACHVKGSGQIVDAVQNQLGVKPGETTDDYQITYEVVYCLGSCGLAPVATVDNQVIGHLTQESMLKRLEHLRNGAGGPGPERGEHA